MILKFLLVVALLVTATTVQAALQCRCGTTTFHFRGITHAIKKARVFEGRAERPEYPRQFANTKGYSFSQLCAGVAADQLYEFPIRVSTKKYDPTSTNPHKKAPGFDRVIYNHSNGDFCGCVRVSNREQLCEIVDSSGDDGPKEKKNKKTKASSSHGSAAGSAVGSSR